VFVVAVAFAGGGGGSALVDALWLLLLCATSSFTVMLKMATFFHSYLSAAETSTWACYLLSLSLSHSHTLSRSHSFWTSFYFISILTVIYTDKVITDSPRGRNRDSAMASNCCARTHAKAAFDARNVEIMCWSSRCWYWNGKREGSEKWDEGKSKEVADCAARRRILRR